MRIKNKYLRNRLAKQKAWNKAKRLLGGEFTYKAFMPYYWFGRAAYLDVCLQFERHREDITRHARILLGGGKMWFKSPKWFRKPYIRKERRKTHQVLVKMMQGDLDAEVPVFKHDADWDWT